MIVWEIFLKMDFPESNGRLPLAFDKGGLRLTWPGRHSDANKLQIRAGDIAVLKGCACRNIDGGTRHQISDMAFQTVVPPDLTMSLQDVPEFVNRGMHRRPIDLKWWDCAVDHVASFAIDQVTNICPGGGFVIRLRRKYNRFHFSSSNLIH
jgi:hypothetical protein